MLKTRRDFLQTASAATLGALAAGYPRAVAGAAPGLVQTLKSNARELEKIAPTADRVIVLWMAGGMAATETFDPKRYTPFTAGLNSEQVLSTFPAIDTVVDNIKFSQGLERLAKVIDRGTLIRSYQAGDLGFILHSRHQYQWHTGYAPPQTVAAPHLGAVVSRTLGPLDPAVPAFINIGQRLDLGEGEELKAFTTAGFLGSEYGPFSVPFPDQAADSVRPPGGMSPGRFEDRNKFYRKLMEASPIGQHGSAYQKDSLRTGCSVRRRRRPSISRRSRSNACVCTCRDTRKGSSSTHRAIASARNTSSRWSAASASAACWRGASAKWARVISR
jgi:hypothetical protein